MALIPEERKKDAQRLIVGIELNETTAQVSWLAQDVAEAQTLPVVEGAELYDMPLMLARKKDSGQWLYGREAAQAAGQGEAERIDGLLALAREGRAVLTGGERYQGAPLLALYMKKLLQQLVMEAVGAGVGTEIIEAVQFTVDEPDEETEPVLDTLCGELKKELPGVRDVAWETHAESLFGYLADRPDEAPAQETLAFWCKEGRLVSFRHAVNYRTRPFVAGVARTEESALPAGGGSAADEAFLQIATERLSDRPVSAVYLLGDGFDESWLARSLDYVCRGRRAFLGNNLFSRGAALEMKRKLYPGDRDTQIVFLGPDRILANIGIRCKKRGESHYHALLDAGTSWRSARASLDVLLDRDEALVLEITPLSAGSRRTEVLELTGLPHRTKRERRATRLSLELTMFSVDRARLSVVDLGFGDYYPASGEHWEKYIGLGESADGGAALSDGVVTEPVLCTGRAAAKPYEFPFLETRIFSVEELCYFLVKNDYLLTMEAFSEELCAWLEEECLLRPLADELRELLRRKCSLAAFADTVLEYVRLYPPDEIGRATKVMREGDARDGVEKKLKIIEYLIRQQRLMEAHGLIRGFDAKGSSPIVRARLLYDEGVIYARLFHYDAAAVCMEKAYDLSGDAQVKEAYLAALRLSMSEEAYIDAIGARPELSPESLTLETKLGELLDLFAAGPENHRVNTLQVCLDTGNLRQFDEETAHVEEELVARYERAMG